MSEPNIEPQSAASVSYERYVDAQLAEVRRAVDLARNTVGGEPVPLREYMDAVVAALRDWVVAVLEEQRRGTLVAEQEREKAAQEQRRGQETAEQEREKAAVALRAELQRTIASGDANLKDHIYMQVQQVRDNIISNVAQLKAALESADKLTNARYEDLDRCIKETQRVSEQRLESMRRETSIINDANQAAISKAETATEKRFASVNEWRGQSADRERSQQEQMAALSATFLPREVAEAQFAEVRRSLGELTEKIGKLV